MDDVGRQGGAVPVRLEVRLDQRHRVRVELLASLTTLLSLGVQVEALPGLATEEAFLNLYTTNKKREETLPWLNVFHSGFGVGVGVGLGLGLGSVWFWFDLV